jgi:predicted KAP-like P-loop ATPase
MFLNDQETETDLLYYEAIAKTVVRLINDTPDTPITIGVHGDWGAGKSSVLKMVNTALAKDDDVLCLWFNGWTFEGFADAKTVIIETVVDELLRARSTTTKVVDAGKKLLKRIDLLKLARVGGGAAFMAMTGIPDVATLKTLWDTASAFLEKPDISKEDIAGFVHGAGGFLKAAPPEGPHLPAHIHAFREEFKELLDAAAIRRLIVIVDDLDRCLPATAIATLEAIRLFLFVERTAFIIGADEQMIEYAVREHFPDLPPSTGPVSYARNYLEKLIQVPFRIPALGIAETTLYVTLLLTENAIGAGDERFKKLLAAAKAELQRPWAGRGLPRSAVEKAMGGNMPPEVDLALTISGQVSRILSDGTRGNPRQIKRFMNSMMLRYAIAEERGFGTEVHRPILAKIMLAERFAPEFYEQLARLSAKQKDGKPDEIADLEDEVAGAAKPAKKASDASGDRGPELAEWQGSEWIRGWVAIEPSLKGVDLRPYVFVTRDKRAVLGGFSGAAHLDALADKLMGPAMQAKAATAEVAKLTGTDPEDLFGTLRARITESDKFDKEPKGFQGLIVLVKAHPNLQRKLLTLVGEIPATKAGAWLATAPAAAFSDAEVVAAYRKLLEQWGKQAESTAALKIAAQAALNIKKKQ